MRVPPAALPGRAGEVRREGPASQGTALTNISVSFHFQLRAPPDQGGQCVPAARGQILPVRVVQQEQTKERLADERKRHAVLQGQADGTERQDGSGVVSPQTGPADGQVRPAAAAADEGLCHGSGRFNRLTCYYLLLMCF